MPSYGIRAAPDDLLSGVKGMWERAANEMNFWTCGFVHNYVVDFCLLGYSWCIDSMSITGSVT